MDAERHHHHHRTGSTGGGTTSELFICFTSRLSSSSSSMKISSKSILSPGRGRDPPISLSTSLSRRLRTNGSIKGGQASPMFPTAGGKKRGCGFENPEPSSPKVTCIGQVRVKSKKKQGRKLRTLSRRHGAGEVSFRKLEQARDGVVNQTQNLVPNYQQGNGSNNLSNKECLHGQRNQNQRWVHFPLTICEALRAFGSEFSCLFPCRSSCFSTNETGKEEKAVVGSGGGGENGQSTCGAVFARWLVALQEGEGGCGGRGGGREVELVMGEDEERRKDSTEFEEFTEIPPVRSSRRHVFDDLHIELNSNNQVVEGEGEGEEEGRVSICIPPKNALLLMRCRSDPVKMEALANRFWEPSVAKNEEDDEENETPDLKESDDLELVLVEENVKQEIAEVEKDLEMEVKVKQNIEEEKQEDLDQENEQDPVQENEEENKEVNETVIEEENMLLECLFGGDEEDAVQENEAQTRTSFSSSYSSVHSAIEDVEEQEEEEEKLELEVNDLEDAVVTLETSEPPGKTQEDEEVAEAELERESETQNQEKIEKESSRVLPDCLLLMMCEPKLSMEVSKETWVCSRDFIRWPTEKKKKQPAPVKLMSDGEDESNKNKEEVSTDALFKAKSNLVLKAHHRPPLQQPPRSSCSFPVNPPSAASMATMLEQKLVNAVGYEPFVLTRCKSEPMRTASKLVPETCFWKNRKLEPLRRATLGVGAAGVGF